MAKALLFIPFSIPLPYIRSWNEKVLTIKLNKLTQNIGKIALLLGFRTNIAVHGGALVVISILIFIFQMTKMMLKLEKINTLAALVLSALACLLLTITAGFLLSWYLAFGETFDDEENNVLVTMTLTTPGCPMHDSISTGIENRVKSIDEVGNVEVKIVWEPQWDPNRMSDRAKEWLW